MSLSDDFRQHGFLSGIKVLSTDEAAAHRARFEAAEAAVGSLHYIDRVETVLDSAFELATHPAVLDAVEACIGPDILLYNATYIVKEPGSPAQVKWHQDLTYWGLEDEDAQVSMWLAVAPAPEAAGCMRMIPGSHREGRRDHATGSGDGNVLLLGQHLLDVDERQAVVCSLRAGEASFHHGWTIHASAPNVSDDRRIGLNVQYLAAHNRFAGAGDATAMLVRGEDRFGHFAPALPGSGRLDEETVRLWRRRDEEMKARFTTGTA